MRDHTAHDEPQRLFPEFWRNAESLVRVHLARLGVDDDDAEGILASLVARCNGIEPMLPTDPASPVHRDFGALMIDAVTAEQRLFAAQHNRMPGVLLGDWPPTPIAFDHPFLVALQQVVSQIEAEANQAEGGKGLN